MQFTETVILDKPIDAVWAAFDNTENLFKWQPSLTDFRHMSGEPGQPGAVSELTYREGKRTMVLTETITERDVPEGRALSRAVGIFPGLRCSRNTNLYISLRSVYDTTDRTRDSDILTRSVLII